MAKEKLGFNPWFKIWVRPKTTIRKIVDYNPNFRLFILSAIYGFISLINYPQHLALDLLANFYLILFLTVVLAPLWGYIIFNVATFFIYITGKWFKGTAKFKEARCAFAWANSPIIVNIFIWILLAIVFKENVLGDFSDAIVLTKAQRALMFLSLLSQLIISVWIIVLYINALAEVQRFSIGKAILNIVVAIVIFIAVFFLIALIYFLIMRGLNFR